jgi:hypothetical protein
MLLLFCVWKKQIIKEVTFKNRVRTAIYSGMFFTNILKYVERLESSIKIVNEWNITLGVSNKNGQNVTFLEHLPRLNVSRRIAFLPTHFREPSS